jgi:TatD DNase family protein
VTGYLDTHCHLDLFDDPIATLDRSPDTVVVAVSELPSHFRMLQARFRKDRRVRPALGLHPLRAATAGPLEEGQLVRLLEMAEYIGEVGLDFSMHGKGSEAAQVRVFDRLLNEPTLRQKVVTVHSRGAERAVIERLEAARVTAILHWYSGPATLIDRALTAGLYFSVNPAMMRSQKGQAIISALPRDRVLTESDGPFAKSGRRPAGPADMPVVITALAGHWKMPHEEARSIVHDNMAQLYAMTVTAGKPATGDPTVLAADIPRRE